MWPLSQASPTRHNGCTVSRPHPALSQVSLTPGLSCFCFFFFKQSAQQPFEEEPEQRPAPPERGHSALDGRCSRLFLSPFPPPYFIPRLRLTRSGANGEISATSLLTGPRGGGHPLVAGVACGLQKPQGLKNAVVVRRSAEFSHFCMNKVQSIQENNQQEK